MDVAVETIIAWEKDRKEPEHWNWPGIIAFLGYDPHPAPSTLGERLPARYRQLGVSRREASRRLGMDENTLAAYETGAWRPRTPRSRALLASFLRSGASVQSR